MRRECRERFSPAADFKGNCWLAIPACITARASRTYRDACWERLSAVVGKTIPTFPAHAHPQFYVSGKRPMGGGATHEDMIHVLSSLCVKNTKLLWALRVWNSSSISKLHISIMPCFYFHFLWYASYVKVFISIVTIMVVWCIRRCNQQVTTKYHTD